MQYICKIFFLINFIKRIKRMVLKRQQSLSVKDNHPEERHSHKRVLGRTLSSPDLNLSQDADAVNSSVWKKSESEISTPIKRAKTEAKLDRKKILFNKLKR